MEIRTANQVKKFHFDKQKRKEMTAQEKRAKKIKWLRKLYKDAKNTELQRGADGEADDAKKQPLTQ